MANEDATSALMPNPSPPIVLADHPRVHLVASSLSLLTHAFISFDTDICPFHSLVSSSIYPTMNAFIHNLQSTCTILDDSNYVTWSTSFRHFLHMHGHLSFFTNDSLLLQDLKLEWLIQEKNFTNGCSTLVSQYNLYVLTRLFGMNGLPRYTSPISLTRWMSTRNYYK